MKMPATTDGVPLMAVTTVRTMRTPRPRTSLRKTAVAMAAGTPMAAAINTCSKVPMMAWRMPTVLSALGAAGWKWFWSLVNSALQWMVGIALVGHPHHDEDHQGDDEERSAHHHDGDHPVGRHLAFDDLGGPDPGQGQEADVPADEEPEAPGEDGQLIEDDPDQTERGQRGQRQEGHVPGAEVAGAQR